MFLLQNWRKKKSDDCMKTLDSYESMTPNSVMFNVIKKSFFFFFRVIKQSLDKT